MFGFQMGNLFLQANDDFGWRNIDSLKGEDPDQPRNSAAWKNRTIYMPQYAGKLVRFRFVSFRGGGSASNMALDDIIIYDLPPKDVRPDSLFKPTEDITSCYSVNQELWVNVKNNGGDSIRFNQDTLNITATITRDGQPWAVLTKQVSSDIWFNQNTGLFEPLPSDTSVAVLMDGTFDMYHIGSLFGFGIKLDLQNDEIPVNDSAYYTVLAREEGGNISVNIFPNDTVCSGNPVQVTLENYFGQIAWQERTVNSTDTGFWIPGNFPNNLETYLTFPDSLIYLRALICGNVCSLVDSIEVIKPYPPTGISDSRCESEPGPLTIGVNMQPNIERVYVYDDKDAVVPFTYVLKGDNSFLYDGDVSDTFYLESAIPLPYYPDPVDPTDPNLPPIFDTCVSNVRVPVYASINDDPDFEVIKDTASSLFRWNMPGTGQTKIDTICRFENDNVGVDLDGGSKRGHVYNYLWTIEKIKNGVVDSTWNDSSQTVTVDPWQVEKDADYTYTVLVTTDSGCVAQSGVFTIHVDDKCFTSLKEVGLANGLDIYPNPTSNQLFVKLKLNETVKADIKILSLTGKLLLERTNVSLGNNIEEFDMSELPKGVYFIQIDTEEDRVVQKIIKS